MLNIFIRFQIGFSEQWHGFIACIILMCKIYARHMIYAVHAKILNEQINDGHNSFDMKIEHRMKSLFYDQLLLLSTFWIKMCHQPSDQFNNEFYKKIPED